MRSPKTTNPTTVISAVPAPDQIAYAGPSPSPYLSAYDSATNDTPYPTTTPTLGQNRLNPSDARSALVPATSHTIASASNPSVLMAHQLPLTLEIVACMSMTSVFTSSSPYA